MAGERYAIGKAREREREGSHNDRKSRERAKETDIDR